MKPLQVVALLSAIAVVGMGIQTLAGGKGTLLVPSAAPRVETKALRDIVSEDGDQDGVTDWEELLWGTDPKRTDSNQDGVSDGDDIARRRAKLVPSASSTIPLTETDRLARDFFAMVTSLQSSGKLTPGTMESISAGLADKISAPSAAPAYSMNDLSIVPSNKETLIAFGKFIIQLYADYKNYSLGTELGSLEEIIKTTDRDGLAKMGEYRPLYQAMAKRIAANPTPEPLADEVLSMANASIAMGDAIRDIQLVFDDSAIALSALLNYSKAHSDFAEAQRSIGEYYTKNAMIFR